MKRGGIFFLLLFFGLLAGFKASERQQIRVLLGDFSPPVLISGKGLKISSGVRKATIYTGKIQVLVKKDELLIKEKRYSLPVRVKGSGVISLGEGTYRGELKLFAWQGKVRVVNILRVEDYLAGVIKNEMNPSWPLEALKAQAVLARTYALHKIKNPRSREFDLYADVRDQVYQGVRAEDERAWKAINQTRGEVLFYQRNLAEVFYHSCCGGRTEAVEYVWGGQGKPYLISVACGYCQECPYYFWRYPEQGVIGSRELADALGYNGEEVEQIELVEKSPSGRVLKLRVRFKAGFEVIISGNDFRTRLGRDFVRSTLFRIEPEAGGWVIFGSGSGHGVGLCQWGARGMAEQGKNYQEILRYYFPGTRIRKAY